MFPTHSGTADLVSLMFTWIQVVPCTQDNTGGSGTSSDTQHPPESHIFNWQQSYHVAVQPLPHTSSTSRASSLPSVSREARTPRSEGSATQAAERQDHCARPSPQQPDAWYSLDSRAYPGQIPRSDQPWTTEVAPITNNDFPQPYTSQTTSTLSRGVTLPLSSDHHLNSQRSQTSTSATPLYPYPHQSSQPTSEQANRVVPIATVYPIKPTDAHKYGLLEKSK